MGRPTKRVAAENAILGWGPLRQYWLEINRQEREAKGEQRAAQKVRDKRRAKCRCEAYPWPHRPAGGLWRYPDPPLEKWQSNPGSSRPHRDRSAGVRRQIARANGLHPIRDRAAIEAVMPRVLAIAKQVKEQTPRATYRNMEITDTGLRGSWQAAGPMM